MKKSLSICLISSAVLLVVVTMTKPAGADQPQPSDSTKIATFAIWPDLAPGETTKDPGTELPPRNGDPSITRIEQITQPTVSVYPASKPNGVAVAILPGGGFAYTVPNLEGSEAAPFLNELGITVFVLNYRVSGDRSQSAWKKPAQDSQRTIRWIRQHAEQYHIDPQRVGLLGFSAGGQAAAAHLTARQAAYEAVDEVDEQSFRPDFGMLIYPWKIEDADGNLRPMIQVSPDTPPTFIVSTHDDRGALSTSAAKLYIALKENGVPAELHVYRSGGHGYGVRHRPGSVIHQWPAAATEWLKLQVLK